MKLLISKEFNQKFPEVNLALVEVEGVKVSRDEVLVEKDYKYRDNFEDHRLIKVFQEFYKELGLGSKVGYPAVENMYRRFSEDGYIPRINNVVDASNKVSIETLVPGGVFDADSIKGNMELRFSKPGEEYRPLGGGVESLPEGIAVIADEEKILNLFPYRDSIYPKITNKTKRVAVLADKLKGVSEEEVKSAAVKIGKLIEEVAGGKAGKVTMGKVSEVEAKKINKRAVGEKKRIFSGIRATGRLHIGNYLGAVKGMLKLQEDSNYEMLFSVVDVHAMTTPYDKETLAKKTYEVVLDYLACGLDPEQSILLVQSKVADLHSELMFYFSTVMTVARMQHLPTFKEKAKQYPESVTMALLNYPVLMAADILIYKGELVPVGIDQEPHLEVTREVARKMNSLYGMDFPEPKRFVAKTGYVPSLLGKGKMSKSIEGSYINLVDSKQIIHQKLAKAPTDSGKGNVIPTEGGVASLLTFVELFQGKKKREQYEKQYLGEGIKYYALKVDLTDAIYEELKPIQEKRRELEKNPEYVKKIIEEGAEKARKIAQVTVNEVKEKMGLI
ncbi:MAG: tryptophan--tRNA ligase [Candidatus Beckwithbacteria bacterium]